MNYIKKLERIAEAEAMANIVGRIVCNSSEQDINIKCNKIKNLSNDYYDKLIKFKNNQK